MPSAPAQGALTRRTTPACWPGALKQMQYRSGLIDGFLARTGLDLTPFSNLHNWRSSGCAPRLAIVSAIPMDLGRPAGPAQQGCPRSATRSCEGAVGVLHEREAGCPVLVCELGQRHGGDAGCHLADDRVAFDPVAGDLVVRGLKGSHGLFGSFWGNRLGVRREWSVPGRCRQGAGAVLVGADLVQAAADEDPANAADGEPDFADGHRPQLALVIAAGQVRTLDRRMPPRAPGPRPHLEPGPPAASPGRLRGPPQSASATPLPERRRAAETATRTRRSCAVPRPKTGSCRRPDKRISPGRMTWTRFSARTLISGSSRA